MDATVRLAVAAVLMAGLGGCDKPRAPEWMAITRGDPCAATSSGPCDAGAFYLDSANLSVKSGTPYVILQTRYADGRIGSIHAEANCPRRKLEPTALKETLSKGGALIENRMTTISAGDEKAVLEYACAKR
jgi:hypothetical protein